MNQEKIGKFITRCRKEHNLTQEQLAEQLGISDRAVSKWERGKNLPDASLMLELSNIFNISVNELLSGEIIEKKDYMNKAEEIILEMAAKDELNNRRLLNAMYVIEILNIIILVSVIMLAQYFINDTILKNVVCVITTIICLLGMFYGLKLEVDAGYYECKNCHYKFIPTYKQAFLSIHMGTTRKLKCPKCNKRVWQRKVLKK